MVSDRSEERLTYGSYLRIPELLALQSPLAEPAVPGEMLFILGQQAQELWFKQMLLDLAEILTALRHGEIVAATARITRITQIMGLLGAETELLETLPPNEFHRFRGALKAASGLESEQFRELEIVSGLRDEPYLRMVARLVNLSEILRRWPVSLRDALLAALTPDPALVPEILLNLYTQPECDATRYALVEACSAYDLRFSAWRFHHLQLVDRVIGDRSAGTAGTAGGSYLLRTVGYRFFPELWEVRNRLASSVLR